MIGGAKRSDAQQLFCGTCKSWVFTNADPALGFVNVRGTMLDDAGWFVPHIETQTVEKLPWVHTPAHRSYERFPAVEEYAALVAEYAEHGRRPESE